MISILVFFFVSIMNLLSGLIPIVFTLVPSWTCPVLLLRFYDLECQIIIVLLCENPFVAGVELITQAVGGGFCRGTNGHVQGKCLTWMLMWPYGWWILLKFCHGIWVCVRAGVEFWRLKLFCCGFCWGLCCRTLGNHVIVEFYDHSSSLSANFVVWAKLLNKNYWVHFLVHHQDSSCEIKREWL